MLRTPPIGQAKVATDYRGAPGQLLALFGSDLALAAQFIPAAGVAASTTTFGVYFNGIPAPILYSGGQQINVQVPYEIAGQSKVQMEVVDQQTALSLSETVTLSVVERQPAVFLSPAAVGSLFPGYTLCGGVMTGGLAAAALNADGSVNGCANPAIAGSVVTFYVGGLGPVAPTLATGAIAAAPVVAITPAVVTSDDNGNIIPSATLSVPGAITGVVQVKLQLPNGLPPGTYGVSTMIDGAPLRGQSMLVWTRPQ